MYVWVVFNVTPSKIRIGPQCVLVSLCFVLFHSVGVCYYKSVSGTLIALRGKAITAKMKVLLWNFRHCARDRKHLAPLSHPGSKTNQVRRACEESQAEKDFEESRYSWRISWKERKTGKRANVTLSVACELWCREPLYSVGVGLKGSQSRLKTNSTVLERLIIVNIGEWLWNPTKFFVVCFCSLFWPWPCTEHNSCLLHTEELTNRNVLVT